jgi:hypothetical protein
VSAIAVALLATEAPALAALPTGPPALSGGVDGQTYATLVVGNTVYIGGTFTHAQTRAGASVTRTDLAAFDLSTGALISSFSANANGSVRALATDGTSLYVGGLFTSIGGRSDRYLAKVSLATGAVDPGFHTALGNGVFALQATGSSVYAGGKFASLGYLAKLDSATGVRDQGFSAPTDGQVNALVMSPGGASLAVAGDFDTLSGAPRQGMGLVDPASGSITGPSFADSVRPMLTLSYSDDGTRLFGGSGNANNLAANWNAATGSRTWHYRVGGDVQAINYSDGWVYVGFHDNYEGDTHTHMIAVNAASGTIDTTFRPVFNKFYGVRSMSSGSWGLVIGGQFSTLSGVWAHNWARFPTP